MFPLRIQKSPVRGELEPDWILWVNINLYASAG